MGRKRRNASSTFEEALHSDKVILMDGACGTELQRAGIKPGECYEAWNLRHPERVRAIHEAYRQVGARCLLTNTFQGHPTALARYGLEDQLEAINAAGVALCRETAGVRAFALASVGPMPRGDDGHRVFRSLAGADAILLETWSGPDVFELVHGAIKPVLVSITYQRTSAGIISRSGHEPAYFAEKAQKNRVAALGVNCGRDMGLDEIIAVLRTYRTVTDLPLFARPNAGMPHPTYPLTPAAFAKRLAELIEAGATLIGGCCGTTPAHIAALHSALA